MTTPNKHTVKINGHITSVFLETEFWEEFKKICQNKELSLDQLITQIDREKATPNLSSAIRLYVLNHLRTFK